MNEATLGNRLLVVDDEPAICRLIRRTAEAAAFEVIIADDADAFLKAARFWHPTVIMLDLKMPRTDGIQLLRTLAADKCNAQVVLISGSDSKVLESALRLGQERGLAMHGMLQKPIRLDALREMLEHLRRIPKQLLSVDLLDAIASDALFLHYQPKFDLKRGRFTGVEALVRWHHPDQGVIPPIEFVTLAEESGHIPRLTDWVVSTAAHQAAEWQAQGSPIDVAINISAIDIKEIDLPERLDQHCRTAGIDPGSIVLELTETGVMREAVQMMDVLTRLRIKGFRLSIDDFGTGYSSLVQLQRMPFSEVKIDQSFVTHMLKSESCRVIVDIVIDLARKLGLKSIAEGVEDEATLIALRDMGCDMAQGYHLSRPLAASDIPAFISPRGAPSLHIVA